jgi:NDP-sugar pyrophosphorylase family protein
MQVDYVLILAAGKGTRMGEIGESLPKVIWPIFKKSILELEVDYAKRFNPKKIFVNLFNYKDEVKDHILKMSNSTDVTIIEETQALDIGGAIHNMAQLMDYKGTLLVLNSDQFIFFENSIKKEIEEKIQKFDSVLLSYSVKKIDGYNALQVEGDRVVEIIANDDVLSDDMETYTGMSLIKLESLEKQSGESKFFGSVANLKRNRVGVVNIKKAIYWDFGTLKRYYESMFEICKKVATKSQDPFLLFLDQLDAFDLSLMSEKSYNSKIDHVINLSEKNIQLVKNTIYLSDFDGKARSQKSICRDDKEDLI